ARRRCLLPADGYFEWYVQQSEEAEKKKRPQKQPFFIRPKVGGLLAVAAAVPASVLVLPDATAGVVPDAAAALGFDGGDGGAVAGLLRATGLALPALVVAVPLAALAARRFPAWTVLAAGLLTLVAALGAARAVDSVALAGTVRALQGVGAGTALPAALVLAWERGGRAPAAAWAGLLAAALLLATPLVLDAVPQPPGDDPAGTGRDWRAALAPWTWPAAAALAAVLAHRAAAGRAPSPLPPPRRAERGGLLLASAPCAAFALLAVVAAHGWSPGARLVVAGVAVAGLLGLAHAGTRDAVTGSPFGCAITMVAAGLLVQPAAGPLAGIAAAEAHAGGGAGAPSPVPFAAGAAAALAAAALAARVPPRGAVLAGLVLMAAAPPLGAVPLGTGAPWAAAPLLVPLGAGAGLALAASLRDAGPGAALFGLSLCFPAVLAGQLGALSLQAASLARIRPETDAQRLAGLVEGQRTWLLAAAAAGVVAAVLAARAARGAPAAAPAAGRHCAANASGAPAAR
ncbi:SOS response-associated peptidase family protein, partial [Actinomadura sp. WAC 06369]|uniref:SOS response-associated peptidase family protein n=1 Tax=Actinomadura sp. WAC 06369 TaxID=2203193 RepID=UPI0018F4FD2B